MDPWVQLCEVLMRVVTLSEGVQQWKQFLPDAVFACRTSSNSHFDKSTTTGPLNYTSNIWWHDRCVMVCVYKVLLSFQSSLKCVLHQLSPVNYFDVGAASKKKKLGVTYSLHWALTTALMCFCEFSINNFPLEASVRSDISMCLCVSFISSLNPIIYLCY